MKTALCITTRNRPGAFEKCMKEWLRLIPLDVQIFVVDDASDTIYSNPDYRFEERAGIPRAKNKCLELAYEWGAEHIFLADDDVYPIAHDWHLPYVNSGVNHLCFTFTTGFNGTPSWGAGRIEGNLTIHDLGCGCLMYFTRNCIETVGGFDTAFGLGKYEHVDLSRRIHNAGLTPYKFMDVVGSDKLFHSMDQHSEVERSFSRKEMAYLLRSGSNYFEAQHKSTEFKDFRGLN